MPSLLYYTTHFLCTLKRFATWLNYVTQCLELSGCQSCHQLTQLLCEHLKHNLKLTEVVFLLMFTVFYISVSLFNIFTNIWAFTHVQTKNNILKFPVQGLFRAFPDCWRVCFQFQTASSCSRRERGNFSVSPSSLA